MSTIKSINPWSGELLQEFSPNIPQELEEKLSNAQQTFEHWKSVPLDQKASLMHAAARILREKKEAYGYAATWSSHVHKPVRGEGENPEEEEKEKEAARGLCLFDLTLQAAQFCLADFEYASEQRRANHSTPRVADD